jgi:hypothetical protein
MNPLPPDHLYYFAFGANMAYKSLSTRRKVYPVESHPAILEGYYLNFDTIFLPYLEPCFASIGPTPILPLQPVVNGVLHLITTEEMQKIIETEGGGGNVGIGYQTTIVQVTTYTGLVVNATTLIEVASEVTSRFNIIELP